MRGSNLAITNGTVVTPESVFRADVLLSGGSIEKVARGLSTKGYPTIDATGIFVLPGVIDSHVHMREPGLTQKEDFESGTTSAAAGGVTTVLEMPNTLPPVDSVENLNDKRRLLEPKAFVDFGLFGVLHEGDVESLESMVKAGAVGFKAFLGPTTGNIPPPSDGAIFESLVRLRRYRIPIAFHAENQSMVNFYTAKVRGAGRNDPRAHCDARPSICETEAINRIAFLAEKAEGRAHIVHMSTSEGARIVAESKKKGVAITCETNPQYLSMTEQDMDRLGSLGKINPPLRTPEDVKDLWEGIADGSIDTLGSDHAPHTVEEKAMNIWDAPAGIIGVETLLPLMLDFAGAGRISLSKIAELLSRNPARLYNLSPRKGEIREGSDGDVVLVDMSSESVIRAQNLHSKEKVTPFEGKTVKGQIRYTVVRGNIVYDGKVRARAGEWIRPSLPG